MKESTLLDLVDMIYERGFEHRDWDTVLEVLCKTIKAKSAGLFFIKFNKNVYRVLGSYGVPSDFSPEYQEKLGVHDATGTIMKALPEGTALGAIDHKISKIDHPEFYQKLLLPNNVGYISALNICNNTEYFVGIGIHRAMDQEQFNDKELEVLARLYPHFRRVFDFSDTLEKLYEKKEVLSSALAKVPLGLIAIDTDLKVHFINDLATSLVNKVFGLHIKNKQLFTDKTSSQKTLKSKVQSILDGKISATSLQLENNNNMTPLSITITNSRVQSLDILRDKNQTSNIALMYISHPDLCSHMSQEVLKDVYNLTTSETQLALALTNGLSLQDYAGLKSISVQTVRSQLKSVFNKVQVNSQTDLVRTLIMSSFNILK